MQEIIKVENLGKKYVLGQHLSTRNFREAMGNAAKAIFSGKRKEKPNEFWALRNLSFSLQPGEKLGIIGRNGAGKSTALKLLSRITEPTEGRIIIRGRLSSLLEVGTGFHPELTGKENIYLNGAILGMKRDEIKKKFDEIVEFSGVEKFLDTPVKRYSSGMYVRLAFSVAAHLEPEILVVDEVLAVGDAEFQKKCLGKMSDVAKEGRTILFVSHNMSAISSLCDRAIVLEKGRMVFDGLVDEGIDAYIGRNEQLSSSVPLSERKDRMGNQSLIINEITILDHQGRETKELLSGSDYTFAIDIRNMTKQQINGVNIALAVYDLKDHRWMMFLSASKGCFFDIDEDHANMVNCRIERLPLSIGTYHIAISVQVRDAEIIDYITHALYFDVIGGDFFGTGHNALPDHCRILHDSQWSKV